MLDIEPYKRGRSLLKYCRSLAYELFGDLPRESGGSIADTHLRGGARDVERTLLDNPLKLAGVCAYWLHDGPEDIDGFDVLDPSWLILSRQTYATGRLRKKEKKGTAYLNALLEEAGPTGDHICYIVNKLTYRPNVKYGPNKRSSYQDYVEHLAVWPKRGILEVLGIEAANNKVVDMGSNLQTNEFLFPRGFEVDFLGLAGADEFQLGAFYDYHKVLNLMLEDGRPVYDLGQFQSALQTRFLGKQHRTAINALGHDLPVLEKALYSVRGSGVIDWQKVEDVLFEAYRGALINYPGVNGLREVHNLGLNRGSGFWPEGYSPVLRQMTAQLRAMPE